MKARLILSLCLAAIAAFVGCATSESTAQKPERGPDGTIAYMVPIETSEPDVRIEVNGDYSEDFWG